MLTLLHQPRLRLTLLRLLLLLLRQLAVTLRLQVQHRRQAQQRTLVLLQLCPLWKGSTQRLPLPLLLLMHLQQQQAQRQLSSRYSQLSLQQQDRRLRPHLSSQPQVVAYLRCLQQPSQWRKPVLLALLLQAVLVTLPSGRLTALVVLLG
jgi:hypothetical protein